MTHMGEYSDDAKGTWNLSVCSIKDPKEYKVNDVTVIDKTSNDGGLEENLADIIIDMIDMKTDEVDSKLKPRKIKNSLARSWLACPWLPFPRL